MKKNKKVKGFLALKGNFTPKQFDAIARLFDDVITVGIPRESNIEFIPLPKGIRAQKRNKEVKDNGNREY